ncbi:hypothetical protein KATP_13270 [Kluyvera ascorbata]|nr:hypothetical protein KATP_13270 [Kluyvera ascorbata]
MLIKGVLSELRIAKADAFKHENSKKVIEKNALRTMVLIKPATK